MTWFEYMCMQCHNLFIFSMFSHKSCQLWILVSVKDVGLTSMSCTPLMLVFYNQNRWIPEWTKSVRNHVFVLYLLLCTATCRWDLFLQKVMQCSPILAHAWGLDSPNAFCNHIFPQNDYITWGLFPKLSGTILRYTMSTMI